MRGSRERFRRSSCVSLSRGPPSSPACKRLADAAFRHTGYGQPRRAYPSTAVTVSFAASAGRLVNRLRARASAVMGVNPVLQDSTFPRDIVRPETEIASARECPTRQVAAHKRARGTVRRSASSHEQRHDACHDDRLRIKPEVTACGDGIGKRSLPPAMPCRAGTSASTPCLNQCISPSHHDRGLS